MRNWFEFFTHVKQKGFTPATIVDVGVATDTEDLYYHFPQARYLFVEPCAEFEPSLQRLCQQYNGTYMLAAAGATDGEMQLYTGSDLGGSSKFITLECEDGAYEMKPRTVPQFKIDTMWNTLELNGPALLKVDVQGGELEVIKGAEQVLDNFEIIMLEVGMAEQYIGQPIFHEYIAFMAERGYVVYDIIHTGYVPETGLLLQMDVVFVKKDGQFRQDQRSLPDYSKINHNSTYKGVKRDESIV
jgi:FkbM family methyltransferase